MSSGDLNMKTFRWSLSRKLVFAFVVVIFVLMIFIFYANSNYNNLLTQYNLALENNKKLGQLFNSVSKAHQFLSNSFVVNSYDSYLDEYNNCFSLIDEMKNYITDRFSLGKLTDLERMLQTYGDKANEARHFFSNENTEQAYKSLDEATEINGLIIDRYGYYDDILNKATESRRLDLLASQKTQNMINLIIFVGLVIFCGSFVGLFTNSVTKPVRQLAESAEQISKGNFNISQIEVKSSDEISLLSSVYYKMVQSIKYYIKEIESKAELQRRLMAEENRNLRNETLLKQTQLNALQAQINPHFLFNTLNMIKQTAFLENAQETRVMLETTSQLLRFYIDKAGTKVSLKEELENVENYIYIQNKRMGKRIKFDMIADDNISDVQIPSLVIQPLLENSIMHGLENCIQNGKVVVKVTELEESIKISVSDNGKGMSNKTIEQILNKQQHNSTKSIGLANVLQRLELFYDEKGLMEISSELGAGTTVTLTLPKKNH